MKWYSEYKHLEKLYFIIEEDTTVGFYLYVYEDKEFFNDDIEDPSYASRHQQDHLQDTLQMAQGYAKNHFNVPMTSWVEVPKK